MTDDRSNLNAVQHNIKLVCGMQICCLRYLLFKFTSRHKSRLHIRQLVKETLASLKEACEADQHTEVGVSLTLVDSSFQILRSSFFFFFVFPRLVSVLNVISCVW